MVIVHVAHHVKVERIDAYKAATLQNAQHTRQEPGNLRFDVLQQEDDPTRFLLVEVYRSPEAADAHRQSPHFLAWREAMSDIFAEMGSAKRYTAVFPAEADWNGP